jgi:AcrR family transcriptional regulator
MRVTSTLSNGVRVAPQQDRSARRLAGFLDAAAELFAEIGFEAATMTAIAERSGSSIGALYNYFRDKESIASSLMNRYVQELNAQWKPLMEQGRTLGHAEFADLFIERIIDFVRKRPAFLKLLVAPIGYCKKPQERKASRLVIADAFRTKNPLLSNEQSMLAANITLQIVGGMMRLYEESEFKVRPLVVTEFKKVLTSYLGSLLWLEPLPGKQKGPEQKDRSLQHAGRSR